MQNKLSRHLFKPGKNMYFCDFSLTTHMILIKLHQTDRKRGNYLKIQIKIGGHRIALEDIKKKTFNIPAFFVLTPNVARTSRIFMRRHQQRNKRFYI